MSRSLRIGITCYPTFGGSGIVATEIGLSLARRGHRIHFICREVPWRLERFVENVFFHEVEARDYPLFDHSPYTLALASKLVEVSSYEKLDLVHVHYAIPHAVSGYLMVQILGKDAPRLITTLHGTDITVVGNDPSFLPVTRFAIEKSDAVTVPSQSLAESTYVELGVSRSVPIRVIPNFVDTERYRPAPYDPSRPLRVVHNSNFRAVKRVDDVVRIFAEVRRAIACQLILIGDGPERSRIEQQVRELGLATDVVFLGKQLDVAEVLKDTDVFLLPSALESFGLAALEALSCGVPVVASRVGGLPEVIDEAVTGFLHPVGAIVEMAARVRTLLEDRALRVRMGEAARAQAVAKWPREPMVSLYEAFYEEVLKK